jgi:hypothetical protein
VIANSYSQLGWSAPPGALNARSAPDTIALDAATAPYPDRQQFDAMLRDIHSMRQSIDRVAAGQERIARSIDQIATSIAASQEQTTRIADQPATSVAQVPSANLIGITVESRAEGASLQPAADTSATKARPASEHDASCFHQLRLCCSTIEEDGHPGR